MPYLGLVLTLPCHFASHREGYRHTMKIDSLVIKKKVANSLPSIRYPLAEHPHSSLFIRVLCQITWVNGYLVAKSFASLARTHLFFSNCAIFGFLGILCDPFGHVYEQKNLYPHGVPVIPPKGSASTVRLRRNAQKTHRKNATSGFILTPPKEKKKRG